MNNKHQPSRTCIGCRQNILQNQLIRITTIAPEMIIIDRQHNQKGRGAYLCPKKECLDLAIKRKAISHNLKRKFSNQTISDFVAEFSKNI